MSHCNLLIGARDGMSFRDGRAWSTSALGWAGTLDWPFPSTVAGALRTLHGRAQERSLGRILSKEEWLQQRDVLRLGPVVGMLRPVGVAGDTQHLRWPFPNDASMIDREMIFLEPRLREHQSMGIDEDPARENLWTPRPTNRGKPQRSPRWLSHAQLVQWLSEASLVAPESLDVVEQFGPRRHTRIHVGIDPITGAAKNEVLFAEDVIEPFWWQRDVQACFEWGLATRVEVNGTSIEWGGERATLGGKGRLAQVEATAQELFDPPKALLNAFKTSSRGLRLLLVSPACFEAGWLPDGFTRQESSYVGQLPDVTSEVVLRAAYVERPEHVSGWDIVKGQPKPVDRLVPRGSVYFFEKTNGEEFTPDEAKSLWLNHLGKRTGDGFGCVLPGIWRRT